MSTDLGHQILEIEDLLCSPDRRGELARLRAALPVGQADQIDAASRASLMGHIRTVLAMPGATFQDARFADLPGWIRLGILTALGNYATGTGLTCRHAPSRERPSPVFACAWKPGAYTCVPCAPMLFPEPGSAADRTCDGCDRICSPGETNGVTIRTWCFGPLNYAVGLCSECRAETGTGPDGAS